MTLQRSLYEFSRRRSVHSWAIAFGLLCFTPLIVGCAGEPVMDQPGDFANESLYCSSSAIEGGSPMMAWRVEVTPGGRCHEVVLRFDAAGHRQDGQSSIETIEEVSVAVGPLTTASAQLSFADASLDVLGIDGHPGLWAGTLTRAGEEYPVSCWSEAWQPRYRYDPSNGRCADSAGESGLNPIAVPVVRDSGIGECADLRGVMLNEDDLSYPEWRGADLRGADLSAAQLSFAHIYDAQLEGTRLSTLEYGYAYVTGTTDRFTDIPETGGCVHEDSLLDCSR